MFFLHYLHWRIYKLFSNCDSTKHMNYAIGCEHIQSIISCFLNIIYLQEFVSHRSSQLQNHCHNNQSLTPLHNELDSLQKRNDKKMSSLWKRVYYCNRLFNYAIYWFFFISSLVDWKTSNIFFINDCLTCWKSTVAFYKYNFQNLLPSNSTDYDVAIMGSGEQNLMHTCFIVKLPDKLWHFLSAIFYRQFQPHTCSF